MLRFPKNLVVKRKVEFSRQKTNNLYYGIQKKCIYISFLEILFFFENNNWGKTEKKQFIENGSLFFLKKHPRRASLNLSEKIPSHCSNRLKSKYQELLVKKLKIDRCQHCCVSVMENDTGATAENFGTSRLGTILVLEINRVSGRHGSKDPKGKRLTKKITVFTCSKLYGLKSGITHFGGSWVRSA